MTENKMPEELLHLGETASRNVFSNELHTIREESAYLEGFKKCYELMSDKPRILELATDMVISQRERLNKMHDEAKASELKLITDLQEANDLNEHLRDKVEKLKAQLKKCKSQRNSFADSYSAKPWEEIESMDKEIDELGIVEHERIHNVR